MFQGLPPERLTTVIRDGKKLNLPEKELMKGDLVELKAGDPVPADIRIIAADKCKVKPQEQSEHFIYSTPCRYHIVSNCYQISS